MDAIIKINTGKEFGIKKLSKILTSSASGTKEITDFNTFMIYSNVHYSFQGDSIVAINGNDILAVTFTNNKS